MYIHILLISTVVHIMSGRQPPRVCVRPNHEKGVRGYTLRAERAADGDRGKPMIAENDRLGRTVANEAARKRRGSL